MTADEVLRSVHIAQLQGVIYGHLDTLRRFSAIGMPPAEFVPEPADAIQIAVNQMIALYETKP